MPTVFRNGPGNPPREREDRHLHDRVRPGEHQPITVAALLDRGLFIDTLAYYADHARSDRRVTRRFEESCRKEILHYDRLLFLDIQNIKPLTTPLH